MARLLAHTRKTTQGERMQEFSFIGTEAPRKLPGVRAVITGYNTPEIRIGFIKDNFALKKGKVRQFRDEVAAVAAIDPEIAEEAVDLIRVEYEELPGVFTPEEALREDAPLVHEVDVKGRPKTDNVVPVPWKVTWKRQGKRQLTG